jgi:hypothetical protein
MIILQKKEFALSMNPTQLDYSMLYTRIWSSFSGFLLVRGAGLVSHEWGEIWRFNLLLLGNSKTPVQANQFLP